MEHKPYSDQFEDIYFSREDGLAETHHVFLENNNFPAAWQQRTAFTIAETGFGTGLNFLAAWTLFEETALPDAILDYVSFELYPLSSGEIEKALAHWSGHFGGRLEKLLAHYPLRTPGWHRVEFGRVRLTLVFDDVNDALPRMTIPSSVDAWFLDGFAPAKNPQMWTQTVFGHLARLSHAETTLASFTAAGMVKNGLREAGFHIEKCRGYGRKRDMIRGRYQGQQKRIPRSKPKSVAIVGGGLAGTACASVLRGRNVSHTLFESAPDLASGASGNLYGIFNPRFSAQRSAESDFYTAAFSLAARTLKYIPDVGYLSCGSLHLMTDDNRRKRFYDCLENWRWHQEHMAIIDADAASKIAGIALKHDALYLPDSGQASPRDLCHHWAEGSEIVRNKAVEINDLRNFDAVIIACGAAAKNFIPSLPIETVRGQIMEVAISTVSAALKTNLCYGGYLGAANNRKHVAGSTFQKWLETTEIREEDNADILSHLENVVPGLGLTQIKSARASLRCASQDRLPIIGAVPEQHDLYVSTAHGSHGIISSLAGAHILADLLTGSPYSLPQDSVNMLSMQRFIDRAARRKKMSV